jgi:predicted permease
MSVEGHPIKDGEDMQAYMNGLSSDYWKTMGIPLIAGRDFNEGDGISLSMNQNKGRQVAIVNQKFATHFFGNQSPLGRHIAFGDKPKKLDIEIVGVTADTLYEGPREGVHRQVFLPFLHVDYPAGVTFYVRTAVNPETMYSVLRAKVRELDAAMPVFQMKTLGRQLDEHLSTERLIATLSAAFGLLATILAAIGLYGVMAFIVARRTREIGLRMALGAPQRQVVWMVLRETLVLAGAGLAIGLPAALLLSKYVSTQLYGVKPTDLGAAAAALLILSAVATGAGFLPARRASEIDPIQALRYE